VPRLGGQGKPRRRCAPDAYARRRQASQAARASDRLCCSSTAVSTLMTRKPKHQKSKRAGSASSTSPRSRGQAWEVSGGALSLHQLFEQQTRRMLDRTDLSEEQKQNLLVAMSCPCCGAGAMSYTVKLKR